MADQRRAEALDDDKLGGEYPPERPLGVEEYGTTHAEEAVDEPLEERVAREEPEQPAPDAAEGDDAIELIAPDEGAGTDDEAEEVARAVRRDGSPLRDDPASGGPGDRDPAEEMAGGPPAEEAAVRLVDEDEG